MNTLRDSILSKLKYDPEFSGVKQELLTGNYNKDLLDKLEFVEQQEYLWKNYKKLYFDLNKDVLRDFPFVDENLIFEYTEYYRGEVLEEFLIERVDKKIYEIAERLTDFILDVLTKEFIIDPDIKVVDYLALGEFLTGYSYNENNKYIFSEDTWKLMYRKIENYVTRTSVRAKTYPYRSRYEIIRGNFISVGYPKYLSDMMFLPIRDWKIIQPQNEDITYNNLLLRNRIRLAILSGYKLDREELEKVMPKLGFTNFQKNYIYDIHTLDEEEFENAYEEDPTLERILYDNFFLTDDEIENLRMITPEEFKELVIYFGVLDPEEAEKIMGHIRILTEEEKEKLIEEMRLIQIEKEKSYNFWFTN